MLIDPPCPTPSRLRPALVVTFAALLSGCSTVVLDPAGDVARQQGNLVIWSTVLMLVIIVPVIVLTVLFAWRYRATNEDATYEPDWDHSTQLELLIWAAPLLIIICLGALTWVGAHLLDPYRPIGRIDSQRALTGVKPLEIDVVALDWKWLFIYPEQGIATVNALALPVDRPIRFRITGSSVMNSFYIPALAGQIYAMPGMETKLHAVLNHFGRFEGFSANYSGAGFSDMRFTVLGTDGAGFGRWVDGVRGKAGALDTATYLKLEQPSEKVKPLGFGRVDPALFERIVNLCAHPGTPCMSTLVEEGRGNDTSGPAPVADAPGAPAKNPPGALFRSPEQKGSSPNVTAPRGQPAGNTHPDADANRNMTMLTPAPAAGLPA